MKFFVTGVGGQLGHDVMNELIKRGHEGVGSDIQEQYSGVEDGSEVTKAPYLSLDITDKEAVKRVIESVKPDAVIHCAAWTAVDMAEDDDKVAKVRAINAGGTQNIADVCKKLDCKMTYISKAYKKQLQPDAIVHSNGQKVTVGEKKIREVFMDPKLIARMMEFCREHHLCIGMNIGKYGCYVNKEVLIEHEKRIFGDGDREYIDESNLLTHPFYGLAYFGDPKGTDLLREAFPEIKTPLFADRRGADVITKEVSKANGIQALLDYYQKDWSDIVAFGDSMNDYEMIEKAGNGIAMGNAVDKLKEVADYVTRPIEEEGVSFALRHYGYLSADQ